MSIRSGGDHEDRENAHLDIMIGQFGSIRNVFVGEKAGSQAFHERLAVSHPFGLETRGGSKVEEEAGMVEPEVDSKFTVGFRSEGRSGETRRRAQPFRKNSGGSG